MSIRQRTIAAFNLYRELAKSGIVALVLISVLSGYLIGQPFEIPLDWRRMLFTLIGVMFLASGSSALNQWQEREADASMPRTASRPLPSGRMSGMQAGRFILCTVFLGLVILMWLDWKLLLLGLAAVLTYNGLYTMWWKRNFAYAAVPGAIPGALPILIGYTASSGQVFEIGGVYLFALLFFWQMPHFWALALRYEDDYRRGGFPTLPVARGKGVTLYQILLWCLAYVGLALSAPVFLRVKWIYLAPTLLMSAKILWELRRFARSPEAPKAWLHFFLWVNFSLIVFLAAAAGDLWAIYL